MRKIGFGKDTAFILAQFLSKKLIANKERDLNPFKDMQDMQAKDVTITHKDKSVLVHMAGASYKRIYRRLVTNPKQDKETEVMMKFMDATSIEGENECDLPEIYHWTFANQRECGKLWLVGPKVVRIFAEAEIALRKAAHISKLKQINTNEILSFLLSKDIVKDVVKDTLVQLEEEEEDFFTAAMELMGKLLRNFVVSRSVKEVSDRSDNIKKEKLALRAKLNSK